ncbi:cobalamin B12-binding domain-containing protein [Thermaurantiacus sp.]
MATVGMNLALSLEGLLQRFPALRDFGLRRLRRTHGDIHPANLAAIIEQEIIPRLLVAHLADSGVQQSFVAGPDLGRDGNARLALSGRGKAKPEGTGAGRISAGEVAVFARKTLEHDVLDLVVEVEAMVARGIPAGTILVDLLAPAARELGRMWEADCCDFIDVTMGLWRLQELAHEVSVESAPSRRAGAPTWRALFAPMPGDDHRFGPILVSEYFRASGWDAEYHAGAGADELCAELASSAYDLLGLTVTQDRQVEELPEFIEGLRRASRNPSLLVMVGGALLVERPELAFLVGADATAPDARTAVERAEALVRSRKQTGAWPS